jgi:hypothetical protein
VDYRDWAYGAEGPPPRRRAGRHSAEPDPVSPQWGPGNRGDEAGDPRGEHPRAGWGPAYPVSGPASAPVSGPDDSRSRGRHHHRPASPADDDTRLIPPVAPHDGWRPADDTVALPERAGRRIAGHDDHPVYPPDRPRRPRYGDDGDDPPGYRRGRRDSGADTGQWERMTDTGQYEYEHASTSGEWDRLGDTEVHDPAQERFDAFWSGHRLAGDDPRWVPTPSSAPRSPAIDPPAGRPRRAVGPRMGPPVAPPLGPPVAPPLGPPMGPPVAPPLGPPMGPPRRGEAERARAVAAAVTEVQAAVAPVPVRPTAGPARRQPVAGRAGVVAPRRRQPPPIEDLDPERGGVLAALLYTAAWYAVPVLVFTVWVLMLDGTVPNGCVSDVTGGGCESERAHALASLMSGVPTFGLALLTSLVAAILLRWVGHGWRAVSVGIGAAVIGGGLSTVVMSALSGQPIG